MPRRRKESQKKGGLGRGLLLLALGFTGGLGAAATFAVHVNKLPLPFSAPPTRDSDGADGDSVERTKRETLEFHETLRKRRAPAAAPEDGAPSSADNLPRQFVYYLQLGAFARRDAAEELRGQIALTGAAAEIRPGKNAGGGDVFRVWTGPFETRNAAERVRAEFALQGRDGIQLLKLAKREP